MNKIVLSIVMFMSLIGNAMADVRAVKYKDYFNGTSWTSVVIDGVVRYGERSQTAKIILYQEKAYNTLFGGVQLQTKVFLGDRFVCQGERINTYVDVRVGNKKETDAVKFKDGNSGHYYKKTFTKKHISAIVEGKEIAFKYKDTCGTTQITTFDTTRITTEAKVLLDDLLAKMNKK